MIRRLLFVAAMILGSQAGNTAALAGQSVLLSSPGYMGSGTNGIVFHGPDGIVPLDPTAIREASRIAAQQVLERAGYAVQDDFTSSDPDLNMRVYIAITRDYRPVCNAAEQKPGCVDADLAKITANHQAKNQPLLERGVVIADELSVSCELVDTATYEPVWKAAESIIAIDDGVPFPAAQAEMVRLVEHALREVPPPTPKQSE